MAKIFYPDRYDLEIFVDIVSKKDYDISRYLPSVSSDWYRSIGDCIKYVEQTSHYESCNIYDVCARLLYKIVKKHELADSNKRSAVIAVAVLCMVNDYIIDDPEALKMQAKKIARSRGRANENKLRNNVAKKIESFIRHVNDL